MLTLEEVREALLDRRIDMVAEATGLHYSTVREIRANIQKNPSYKAIKALSDYLEGRENEPT